MKTYTIEEVAKLWPSEYHLFRKFVFKRFFVSWVQISLGISFSFKEPNIEFHLPFGFIKIGWEFDLKEWPSQKKCSGCGMSEEAAPQRLIWRWKKWWCSTCLDVRKESL